MYPPDGDHPHSKYVNDFLDRDSRYADLTVADIVGSQIFDLRQGAEVDAMNERLHPAGRPTVADLSVDPGTVIAAALGISNGLADAAGADLAAIDALLARIAPLRAKAEEAKDALDAEAVRLLATVPVLNGQATRDEAAANVRESEIDNTDRPARQAEWDMLDSQKQMLENELAALSSERADLDLDRGTAQAFVVWYENGEVGDRPSGSVSDCTDLTTCTAEKARLDGLFTAKDAEVKAKDAEVKAKDAEVMAKQSEIDDLDAEVPNLRAAVQALRDQAVANEFLASSLESKSGDAQDRIDSIAVNEGAARDRQTADRTALAGFEGGKAGAVLTLLRSVANDPSHTNPSAARFLSADDISDLDSRANADRVFARAERPAGTRTAAQALAGINEGFVRRDVTAPLPASRTDAGNGDTYAYTDLADDAARDAAYARLRANKTALGSHDALNLSGQRVLDIAYIASATVDPRAERGTFYAATFKGVHGTLYCDGSRCNDLGAADATRIGGGWYFTPSRYADPDNVLIGQSLGAFINDQTNPTRFRYVDSDGDGTWEAVRYVDYGMWLTGADDALGLETRRGLVYVPGTTGVGVDLTTVGDGTNRLANRATYDGTAHGLSARVNTDGVAASGHFEADVRLNATFGASPTLGGTIGNFRSADPAAQGTAHVGSWAVDLGTADLGTGTGRVLNAPFSGSGTGNPTSGGWSAYGYGDSGRRPAGFHGGFEADFTDGAAVGQFAAD